MVVVLVYFGIFPMAIVKTDLLESDFFCSRFVPFQKLRIVAAYTRFAVVDTEDNAEIPCPVGIMA